MPAKDKGKSGGYIIIIIINNNAFVPYIFLKSDKETISKTDLYLFKKMAKDFVKITEEDIKKAIECGIFIELKEGNEHERI